MRLLRLRADERAPVCLERRRLSAVAILRFVDRGRPPPPLPTPTRAASPLRRRPCAAARLAARRRLQAAAAASAAARQIGRARHLRRRRRRLLAAAAASRPTVRRRASCRARRHHRPSRAAPRREAAPRARGSRRASAAGDERLARRRRRRAAPRRAQRSPRDRARICDDVAPEAGCRRRRPRRRGIRPTAALGADAGGPRSPPARRVRVRPGASATASAARAEAAELLRSLPAWPPPLSPAPPSAAARSPSRRCAARSRACARSPQLERCGRLVPCSDKQRLAPALAKDADRCDDASPGARRRRLSRSHGTGWSPCLAARTRRQLRARGVHLVPPSARRHRRRHARGRRTGPVISACSTPRAAAWRAPSCPLRRHLSAAGQQRVQAQCRRHSRGDVAAQQLDALVRARPPPARRSSGIGCAPRRRATADQNRPSPPPAHPRGPGTSRCARRTRPTSTGAAMGGARHLRRPATWRTVRSREPRAPPLGRRAHGAVGQRRAPHDGAQILRRRGPRRRAAPNGWQQRLPVVGEVLEPRSRSVACAR